MAEGAHALSDNFTRGRMKWLDQLAADEAMRDAFRLGYVLTGYMNRETGEAWPTQETLADRTGLSIRSVRDQLRALVAAGYLECKAGRGRHTPNVYRLGTLENRQPTAGLEEENRQPTAALRPRKPAIQRQKTGSPLPTELFEELSDIPVGAKPAVSPADPKAVLWSEGLAAIRRLTGKPDDAARRLIGQWRSKARNDDAALLSVIQAAEAERPAEPISWIVARLGPMGALSDPAASAAFDRFRSVYPKAAGQNWDAARKAFARAVADGTDPGQIVAGVERFARAMRQEQRPGDKIRQPDNWLDRNDWAAWPSHAEAGAAQPAATDEQWRDRLARFQRSGAWPQGYGPRPGSTGCCAPAAILAEFQLGAA